MFIGKWNKSVILTYIGLAFAITGMYIALVLHKPGVAFMCLVAAGVCDMFDGKIARMCKRDEEEIAFGIELDSLVDVVCFIILPIIIYISLGFTKWYNLISYILLGICGIARLGYYNVCTATKDGKAVKYYEGLPVTVAAITFPVLYLFHHIMTPSVFYVFFSIVVFVEAILNVLKFKLRKSTKWIYPILSIGAIILAIIYAVLIW